MIAYTQTALQIVEKTLVLLEDPKAWTKHALAKSAYGLRVDAESTEAVCFCLMGALTHSSTNQDRPEAWAAYDAVRHVINRHIPGALVQDFNDAPATEHRHVVSILRETVMYLDNKPQEEAPT